MPIKFPVLSGGGSFIIFNLSQIVPKMTSNTTPSGQCISSGVYGGVQPYQLFGDNTGPYAHHQSGQGYLGYIAEEDFYPVGIQFDQLSQGNTGSNTIKTFILEATQNGADWFPVSDVFNNPNSNDTLVYFVKVVKKIKGLRIRWITLWGSTQYNAVACTKILIFGLKESGGG